MPDLSVLDFDHLPNRLPNRGQELQTIDSALRRLEAGQDGQPVRIYGPSGAGKTTVATFAAREAADAYGVQYATVDCIEHRTRAAVLHSIARQLGMATASHEGTSAFTYHEYFKNDVDQAVVVLDEASQLADTTVIREVFETGGLTVMVVTHDGEKLESRISESVASRLRTGQKVHCDRYSTDELVQILDARLRAGDLRTEVTNDALQLVAEISAGNARDAIATLKEALSQATGDGGVTTDVVGDVKVRAKEKVIRRNLAEMDTEHRVIYRIIASAGEISAPELKKRVEEELDISNRKRRRFTDALVYANAVEEQGSGRGKTYSPVLDVDTVETDT